MSREVRKVHEKWEHPKDDTGDYMPLSEGISQAIKNFENDIADKGVFEALVCNGGGPDPEGYMPEWPEEEKTHFQMYETTTEGTPISEPMDSPEALAKWLADTKASSFGSNTATYEQWLRVCKGGLFAPSAIIRDGHMMSGVEGLTEPN